jgi:hypothetical protein
MYLINYSVPLANLLLFYGLFLMVSGIVSVVFIGMKAKTALISGGTAGTLNLATAFLISRGFTEAAYAALFLPFALFIVFSWRTTKTLFYLFEMISAGRKDFKDKATAFLIIALMAIVSLVVLLLQVVFWNT